MKQLENLSKYWQQEEFRSRLVINHSISTYLDCCEAAIRSDCAVSHRGKTDLKKKEVPKQFKEAFLTLSREEKIEYYLRVMGYLRSFVEETFNAPISPYSGMICDVAWSRGRRWKEKKYRLDQQKHLLYAQRSSKIHCFDLKDYIVRTSKNKDYYSFVLIAINSTPSEKYRSLHIGFSDKAKYQLWLDSLKFSTQFREWQFYCGLFKGHIIQTINISTLSPSPPHSKMDKLNLSFTPPRKGQQSDDDPLSRSSYINNFSCSKVRSPLKPEDEIDPVKNIEVEKLQREIKKYQEKRDMLNPSKSKIGELIEGQILEEPEILEERIEAQGQKQKQLKRCLDLFHKLYPQYELAQLQSFTNFTAIHEEQNFRIYQSHLPRRYKMTLSVSKEKFSLLQLMSHLSKPETAKNVNSNIQELQIKTYIASENSALLYQVLKPYSRLYRARDFVFIRHVFRSGRGFYMIDKSIENANYPPFLTIVRGSLCIVYGVFERQNSFEVIADVEMVNQGYLSNVQETNLTLNFLRPFKNFIQIRPDANSYRLFDLDWDIGQNQINHYEDEIRSREKTIKQLSNNQQMYTAHDEEFLRTPSPPIFDRDYILQDEKKEANKSTIEQDGQINAEELLKSQELNLEVVRQLNHQGFVKIDPSYRTYKYPLQPTQKEFAKLVYLSSDEGHPIWRNDWIHDDKVGGIIFVNRKKIEDQKGVLRFILTKMAKNLVSGQSILNVSLPVDIFCPESNLQRFFYSMVYAPSLLQNLQSAGALARLLKVIAFGITNSILYLNMEKPFNPQLGETFQCWINGCPAYAQQISHHPPIAALLIKGRGYDLSALLQSKFSVGVNSGKGTNDGVIRIKFSDQQQVCFMTPEGEVSGLAHGDRKFSFNGKTYYWIPNANIVLQLVFDPYRKGFFSVGKQQQPCDYFQGTIWEVRPEFMSKFNGGKRREPTQKQRVRSLGKVSGTWYKGIFHNGVQIFDLEKEMPLALEHEPVPLPSDSNWREDIEYRRRNQITRAQIEKQRLQVQQRLDRKLRQKRRK